MKRPMLLLSTAVPLLLAAYMAGCTRPGPAVHATPPVAQATLVTSTQQQVPQGIPITGTVHAKQSATLSAQIPATITQVLVNAGDHVRAGQVLVRLDGAAMSAGLSRAEAARQAVQMQQQTAASNAALAKSTLHRYELLKQQNSVSPQEYDVVQRHAQAAELQVQALDAQEAEAKAAVASARTQLGYTVLRSPYSGAVTARMADPGTLATPGMPILQIDSSGPLQLYATVDESLIGSVRLGMQMPVTVDGIPQSLTGRVAQIVPAADPSSRTFLLKLDLPPNSALRPGMYGSAQFPGATRAMILAPRSAITLRGSLAYVYVLDSSGVAQLRYVTLGRDHGNNVEVLSGLAAGEQLINNPGDRDLAGRRIEARQ
jgi:RND family efflux transporter MFP subunit